MREQMRGVSDVYIVEIYGTRSPPFQSRPRGSGSLKKYDRDVVI